MNAIILAAGIGSRLKEYTRDVAKCMVGVNAKSLVERTIEILSHNGIQRLVIVTGYKADALQDLVSSKFSAANLNGMKIEYVNNPLFDKTNNIYSLYLAKDTLLSGETLLLESDLIFTPSIIEDVVNNVAGNVAVVSKYEEWMDGTCVTLSGDKILQFISKKSFDKAQSSSYYKTVNIYKFAPDFCRDYYIPFLETYQNVFGRNDYYERVLDVLTYIQPKMFSAICVPSSAYHEIDTPEDLRVAKEKFSDAR